METIIKEHNRFAFNKQIQQYSDPYLLGILKIDNLQQLKQRYDWEIIEQLVKDVSYTLKAQVEYELIQAFCFVEPNIFFISLPLVREFNFQAVLEIIDEIGRDIRAHFTFGYMEITFSQLRKTFLNFSTELPLQAVTNQLSRAHTLSDYQISEPILRYEQVITEILDGTFASFYLVYQPKYHVTNQRFEGCEVLCRFEHPKFGALSPYQFLPVIGKVKQEFSFDCYIFNQLCEFITTHDPDGKIECYSFNISMISISDARVVDALLTIASKWQVAPRRIVLEIIEDIAEYHYHQTIQHVNALVNAGFQMSIDDFGTGYSSYYRLNELSFNEVKIPREFLLQCEDKAKQVKIMSGIIGLGRSLSCDIVVEGVETQEDVQMLSELSVDFMQGYFFAKPMRKVDYLAFIENQGARN